MSAFLLQPCNMGQLMQTEKDRARKKGWTAAAVAGGSLAVGFLSPTLMVVGLVGAGYFVYDWFTYRAKNGLRF